MDRIPMVALKALPYDRKLRMPGTEFDALPKHADFFIKKGVARLKDAPVVEAAPKPKRKYTRRDLTKKQYKNTAMVAQD